MTIHCIGWLTLNLTMFSPFLTSNSVCDPSRVFHPTPNSIQLNLTQLRTSRLNSFLFFFLPFLLFYIIFDFLSLFFLFLLRVLFPPFLFPFLLLLFASLPLPPKIPHPQSFLHRFDLKILGGLEFFLLWGINFVWFGLVWCGFLVGRQLQLSVGRDPCTRLEGLAYVTTTAGTWRWDCGFSELRNIW
ncbi:uncharacterized protein K460DRAFT_9445 [Cucurbitaria berberidis CBS 394.84]|uniref:Transmembrane protein n=1 Tax=Cucurbitaria berberidis CBS 394.84 TaxID=1168544 RepID=A0A9P4GRH7_9PLEO|nr:uncharacterized protein K460DRAFT_9445 [Cucurbitaria berberidis CBS 394.84]KAF1850015.1 hypothetical protein K460DRAFT_9445 [Cucurbitaria berberidis CBS 394.84]